MGKQDTGSCVRAASFAPGAREKRALGFLPTGASIAGAILRPVRPIRPAPFRPDAGHT